MSAAGNPLQDDHGLWDIAYISLAIVTALLVVASVNMVVLIWVEWSYCAPRVILPTPAMPNIAVTVISCKPNLLELGQAFGLSAGAFSTTLLALAAYMAANRRRAAFTTTTTSGPTPEAAAVAPIPVAVVDMPATSAPPARARKAKR